MKKAALIATMLLGVSSAALCQTFEVTSVKRNTSGERSSSSHAPGRWTTINVTLRSLILAAYGLEGFRLGTLPAWVESDRFDVIAKADGNPPAAQLRVMMQHLLADRFHLVVRHQMKELPVYDLVMARADRKLGPAMRRVECATPPCGTEFVDSNVLRGDSVPVAFMTGRLTSIVERVVNDKTNLDGYYAIELQWSGWSDEQTPDPAHPSLFTALQEQLGLKLVSTRGPVDVLVVDHVEQPTAD
jgi:uncharacterized protein (TIGR03435 family)